MKIKGVKLCNLKDGAAFEYSGSIFIKSQRLRPARGFRCINLENGEPEWLGWSERVTPIKGKVVINDEN